MKNKLNQPDVETTITNPKIDFEQINKKCTCTNCPINDTCMYAWDDYNTNGDCLLEK